MDSSKLQRWHLLDERGEDAIPVDGDGGEWVRYSDVAELASQRSELLNAAKQFLKFHEMICQGEKCTETGIDLLKFAVARAEGR